MDAITTSFELIPGQRELVKPPLVAPGNDTADQRNAEEDSSKIVVDIDLRFKDIKAAVPIFTKELSYANNALMRPIVAFMKHVFDLIYIRLSLIVNGLSAPTGH